MTSPDLFRRADFFLDFPFEEAKFRFEHATGRVFRRFYGEPEVEIERSSALLHEAIAGGRLIQASEYFDDP